MQPVVSMVRCGSRRDWEQSGEEEGEEPQYEEGGGGRRLLRRARGEVGEREVIEEYVVERSEHRTEFNAEGKQVITRKVLGVPVWTKIVSGSDSQVWEVK